MSLSVDVIPNRNSPPAILLREAWRDGRRVRRRTIANLSKMPPELIDTIRAALKGAVVFPSLDAAVTIRRSLPHGHVAAALGTLRRLEMVRMLSRQAHRNRDLAIAAIVARIIEPASKLATSRALSADTASTSIGTVLDLDTVTGNEMLSMLDWLVKRQPWIEKTLARRHLQDASTLILYDVSSSYLEGRSCPLAAYGHNRDGKKNKLQIIYGLLCAKDGCPVAIEVFTGNTADPATVSSQVRRIRERFAIARVALVGDRGMITTARISADLKPADIDWISALKTQHIRTLMSDSDDFDPDALIPDQVAEISSPKFPGERLMVCLNPRLRDERRRKREALLVATEAILARIAAAVQSGRLKGRTSIDRRVGRDANRRKVAKHFEITVTDNAVVWQRREDNIVAEARLDGVYIVRTSLSESAIATNEAVEAYKSLAQVERAFRTMKLSRFKVRPIFVYAPQRVKAHVFLCMLAYYVEWHMRQRLAPVLFEDDDRQQARAKRRSPIEPAQVSDSARAKADAKRTPDGLTVHSMTTLLADLATLTVNEVTLPASPQHAVSLMTKPTELQRRVFKLLDIDPAQNVAM